MKPPYVKKFCEIGKISVWIVDGVYVRGKMDEEFINCGQHFEFGFIPRNEFWIDGERKPGEEKYYIDSMVIMYRLMSEGMSCEKAMGIADRTERREGVKSELMKRGLKIKNDKN